MSHAVTFIPSLLFSAVVFGSIFTADQTVLTLFGGYLPCGAALRVFAGFNEHCAWQPYRSRIRRLEVPIRGRDVPVQAVPYNDRL